MYTLAATTVAEGSGATTLSISLSPGVTFTGVSYTGIGSVGLLNYDHLHATRRLFGPSGHYNG